MVYTRDIFTDGTGAEAVARIRVPEMADFDARITINSQCNMHQTPQALAKSGLFYTGRFIQIFIFNFLAFSI